VTGNVKKDWKHLLLRSGLPLEQEVRECFVEQGCTVWQETGYLRRDEQSTMKEFAYDVYANFFKGGYSVDFLIECKYKVARDTKWFFVPHPYHYQYDLDRNDFLHPIDHFVEYLCPLNLQPYSSAFDPLGPFCQKGIELFDNQCLEGNIAKAIAQVSYGFIDKVIGSWESQLTIPMFAKTVFCHVPIIITNAELYHISPEATVESIENARDIEEISSRADFLLLHNPIGRDLQRHNMAKCASFFSSVDSELVKQKLSTFTKDLDHFVSTITSRYSPALVLVMQHTSDHRNYRKLFAYISEVLEPSEETLRKVEEAQRNLDKIAGQLRAGSPKRRTQ
jgi:hypothetical protein